MALGSAYSIFWLDAHIGLPRECRQMKTLFQTDLAPSAALPPQPPPDPIDALICALHEYGANVSFAATEAHALELIEKDRLESKKVIFISSATLGKEIIPKILAKNLQVETYYIFCGLMKANVEWALDYLDEGLKIQMFDFETDLLVRLARDMCNELIEEGKRLMNEHKPTPALKYFDCALALGDTAVARDTPKDNPGQHRPSTEFRRILMGDDGLIAQAKRAVQ